MTDTSNSFSLTTTNVGTYSEGRKTLLLSWLSNSLFILLTKLHFYYHPSSSNKESLSPEKKYAVFAKWITVWSKNCSVILLLFKRSTFDDQSCMKLKRFKSLGKKWTSSQFMDYLTSLSCNATHHALKSNKRLFLHNLAPYCVCPSSTIFYYRSVFFTWWDAFLLVWT